MADNTNEIAGPPIDDSAKPVLTTIATAVRNFYEPAFNNLLRSWDATLLSRGQGKGLKIYDELERDPQVYSTLQKRKLALISRDWDVEPGGDAPIDKAAAETAKQMLKDMPFDRICMDLMDAVLKGYAVSEVDWDIQPPLVVAKGMEAKDQLLFVFDINSNPRLLTQENGVEGISLPERKFVVHRFGSKNGSPYGLGLGTRLFWLVFFKRQSLQFWLTFADKFGNPTVVGKYPASAGQVTSNPSQAKLLSALQAISQETAITIPVGMEIELLEAQRSGSTTTYESLLRYLDEQISITVLGESMSTTGKSGGGLGGGGQARVQNEVRLEITQADADLLSGTLGETLLAWITHYNHPGAKVPGIWWDVSEPTDLLPKAQADQIVCAMGFKPSLEYIQETYGAGWTEEEEPPPPPPPAPIGLDAPLPVKPSQSVPQFAAPDVMSHQDRLVARLGHAADGPLRGWMAAVRKQVDEATSLDDLRDRLIKAYPNMSLTELANGMQAAFAAANLAGRYDILEQARS